MNINLSINADSAEDLRQAIVDLFNLLPEEGAVNINAGDSAKKTRASRSTAKTETATAAAETTGASVVQFPGAVTVAAATIPAAIPPPAQTTAATPVDFAGLKPDEQFEAIRAHIAANQEKRDGITRLFGDFTAKDGTPVQRPSHLKPEDYPAFFSDLQKI